MRYFTSLCFFLALFLLPETAQAFVAVATPANDGTVEATTDAEREALAAVAAYKEELNSMTRKERRQLKRQQRKQVKAALQDMRNSDTAVDEGDALLIVLAILLPPLAVFLYEDEISTKFWISLVLTLLFFLPGIIYALLVVTGNAKK